MSTMKSTLAVVAATAVSITSFVSLALPGHAQLSTSIESAGAPATQRSTGARRAPNVDAFAAIANGMTTADVLAAIGPPSAKTRFAATKTTAWDYRYRDPWGEDGAFAVIVDNNGVVVGKTRVRESG